LSIIVDNQNSSDVDVRALAPGRRISLGQVPGRSRTTLSIPWGSTQELRFQIELPTGGTHTTGGVSLPPGARVELIVQDPIQRSVIRR